MLSVKGAHVVKAVILTCVRWSLASPLRDRQGEELRQECGGRATRRPSSGESCRTGPPCKPRGHRRQCPVGRSWRLDETSIRSTGEWRYLDRAVAKQGRPIACLLTEPRDARAALRLLTQAIRRHGVPETIAMEGSEAHTAALRRDHAGHGTAIIIRQVTYLTAVVEQAHRALTRGTRPL